MYRPVSAELHREGLCSRLTISLPYCSQQITLGEALVLAAELEIGIRELKHQDDVYKAMRVVEAMKGGSQMEGESSDEVEE